MTRNADRTAHMAVDSSALRDLAPLWAHEDEIIRRRRFQQDFEEIARWLTRETGRVWTADEIERFATERGAA